MSRPEQPEPTERFTGMVVMALANRLKTTAYLETNDLPESVIFVCFGREIYDAYRRELGAK